MPVITMLVEATTWLVAASFSAEILSLGFASGTSIFTQSPRIRLILYWLLRLALLAALAWSIILLVRNASAIVSATTIALHWLLQSYWGQHGALLVGSAIATILLFLMRKYLRIAYGLLEVLVAIVGVTAFQINMSRFELPALISLLGLIYIAIRGLDNIEQGRAKAPKKGREGATTPGPQSPRDQAADVAASEEEKRVTPAPPHAPAPAAA